MALSPLMEEALTQRYYYHLKNVPELEQPVLIVLDYSPSSNQTPLSIAFDYSNGPKCWLTVSNVVMINGIGPSKHPDYRRFEFEGRVFHPYSIQAFPQSIFERIEEFDSACRTLYQHADWND